MTFDPPVQEWVSMVVGERFGPFEYVVSEQLVADYRAAIGDFEIERIDGKEIAPMTLLTFPILQLTSTRWQPRPGGVHAGQTFESLAPIRVPSVLTVNGLLTRNVSTTRPSVLGNRSNSRG